LLTSTEQTIWF